MWCEADDTVEEAAIRMTDREIRVSAGGARRRAGGIVSARDLLGVYATDADRAV